MSNSEKRSSLDYEANRQSENTPRPSGIQVFHRHPMTQLCLLGLIMFMLPGVFNAMNGLGAGGQLDSATNSNANTAVYAMLAATAFFSGYIVNTIGTSITLLLGSVGYVIYVGSYLATNIHHNAQAFVIAAGAILGLSAALLWTAQGALMLSYPTERQKGRYVAVFWAIYNLGAVVAAAVPTALNIKSEGNQTGNGTYITFLVLSSVGIVLTVTIVKPSDVIRVDGTKVSLPRRTSWKQGVTQTYASLRKEPWICLLLPFFFSSNYFFTWQFTDYNAAFFDISARSLNNLVYWSTQIVGSFLIGFLLDMPRLSRRACAFAGCVFLFTLVFSTHIWAYLYQRSYTRQFVPEESLKMHIGADGYAPRVILYALLGNLASAWQTMAYWLLGSLSNNTADLAVYVSLYQCAQAVGAAVVWHADAVKAPYMNIFVSTWVLLAVSLLAVLVFIRVRLKNLTDNQSSDE